MDILKKALNGYHGTLKEFLYGVLLVFKK